MWLIYPIQYYSAIKKKILFARKCKELEIIMIKEISHLWISITFSLMWNLGGEDDIKLKEGTIRAEKRGRRQRG
jgi:hypothetical protein